MLIPKNCKHLIPSSNQVQKGLWAKYPPLPKQPSCSVQALSKSNHIHYGRVPPYTTVSRAGLEHSLVSFLSTGSVEQSEDVEEFDTSPVVSELGSTRSSVELNARGDALLGSSCRSPSSSCSSRGSWRKFGRIRSSFLRRPRWSSALQH